MLGESAALGTAVCFVFSSLFFSRAGHRIGSLVVNLVRLVMGLGFLAVLTTITRHEPLPLDASAASWGWLSLSGLVGFVVGDLCLFRAFLDLGARLSALVMSLAPPIAALCGWLWLDERLGLVDLLGMALTVIGVAIAVLDRPSAPLTGSEPVVTVVRTPQRRPGIGLALALVGAVGQAVGLVISKLGMGRYDAFAATEIRVIAGIAGFVVVFTLARRWPRVRAGLRDRAAMKDTAIGAFFGPFLGVGLSLLAVQHAPTGVAASIMATTPILIIPFAIRMEGERVGVMGLVGALLAVAGVVLLFAA